jgi:hypothetical protein
MKIEELRELLKDKLVADEINKHLWIESQKAGYSIGIERATDEWLRFHAAGWLKFHKPEQYDNIFSKGKAQHKRAVAKKKAVKKAAVKKAAKKVVKKTVVKKAPSRKKA